MSSKKTEEKKVPEKKKQLLKELVELMKKYNTIMVISIGNIPSIQFQRTKKDLKADTVFKVVKKNMAKRALEAISKEKEKITQLEDKLEKNFVLLFTNKDAYEIAAIFNKGKIPAKAKPGQVAPTDIILKEGPTDLPVGPAITELSKMGIKSGVDGGKIAIKETKTIVKEGETITPAVASLLSSLEITPFFLSLKPMAAYNTKEKAVYFEIDVDSEKTLKDLKELESKALAFALFIDYPCKETIKFILAKANNEFNTLSQKLNLEEKK